MGLIRAAIGAVGGTMADQWLEFFYADAIPANTLVVRGQKQAGKRSQNKGSDNIISNGSGIAVADGQAMIIIDAGRIVDFCAEPGQYTWTSGGEPSIFAGSLGESIKGTFATIGRRIAHGGDTGKDQRVYYFNLKAIMGNKFGTATPVPFRVVDNNIGLDIDTSVRCNGVFSFRMTDPMLFYANVSGNVTQSFTVDKIIDQMKSEFLHALQPAFARLSAMGLRPSAIPAHTAELAAALDEALSDKWQNLRGLKLGTVAINSITLPEEDAQMIRDLQRTSVMRDTSMAGATIVTAQADAMRLAASNEGGAMMGFMGLNMAQQAGGMNAQELLMAGQAARTAAPAPVGGAASGWACSCGVNNTGRFCSNCGSAQPAPAGSWTCSCGVTNSGRFCSDCGSAQPANDNWNCNCGAANTGRFCSECGGPRN